MTTKLRELMPHQEDALAYAAQKGRIALFMEMRLGKTLVAIRWCKDMARHYKVLVVAPLPVLNTWYQELIKEGIYKKDIHHIKGSLKQRNSSLIGPLHGFFLIGYEALRVTPAIGQDKCIRVLILDESTRIKNPKAQVTKICLKHLQHISYRAILSGLPAPESPLDYFCQMKFLYPDFLGCWNYWQFKKTHTVQAGEYDWFIPSKSLKLIKDEVNSKAFVLTRKDCDIGSTKIYEKRYIQMNAVQKKIYKQVEDEFAYNLPEGESAMTNYVITKVLWLARIAGGFSPQKTSLSDAKNREIFSLLSSELKDQQVVIWFRFNSELETTAKFLEEKGYIVGKILGEVNLNERNQISSDFQEGHKNVLCVQIKCGKFGVDWSNASTAIYYSNSYSSEDRAQSEDRIIHPSKKEPLLYLDLITEGTVDEDVVETLKEKARGVRYFMNRLMVHFNKRRNV